MPSNVRVWVHGDKERGCSIRRRKYKIPKLLRTLSGKKAGILWVAEDWEKGKQVGYAEFTLRRNAVNWCREQSKKYPLKPSSSISRKPLLEHRASPRITPKTPRLRR